ncbi:MAG: L,D-transpeptidase [Acidimicrobiia bacterium]
MSTGTRIFVVLALVAGLLAAIGGTASAVSNDAGVGLVDPTTGEWFLRDPGTGDTTHFYFGNPGDKPFTGDWDCDSVDTPGLYRSSDGYVYLRNSNTQGVADVRYYFGNPGDIPIAGDFNGDGCDTVSIYRPSEHRFYIINTLGADGEGLGAADIAYTFGVPGDQPIAGDFDGNGTDTVGVYRPYTSTVYLQNSHKGGDADVSFTFGERSDKVVMAAWSGGVDTVGVYRPSTGTFHVRNSNSPGAGDASYDYGYSKYVPIAGTFGALPGGHEAPPTSPPYPNVGSGKRIIYSNSLHQVWLIDEKNELVDTYPVTGRKGIPLFGTYKVFSKSVNAWAPYGGITMKHMVRFVRPGTFGNQWSYGFHSIPRYSNGRPMQTEAQLGSFGSGGCVRQADHKALALYNWAPIGTTVHAIP